LLEVLGPSKVYREVIKKVINSTVAEYVDKVTDLTSCLILKEVMKSFYLHGAVINQ
jgi:hypothetical protein